MSKNQKRYRITKIGLYITVFVLSVCFLGAFFTGRKYSKTQQENLNVIMKVDDYQKSVYQLNRLYMEAFNNAKMKSLLNQDLVVYNEITYEDLEFEWNRFESTRNSLLDAIRTGDIVDKTIWMKEEKAYSIFLNCINNIKNNIVKDFKFDNINYGLMLELQNAQLFLADELDEVIDGIERSYDSEKNSYTIRIYWFQFVIGSLIACLILLIFGPSKRSIRGLMTELKYVNENVLQLLYSFHGAMFLVDKDYNIQWMNKDAEEILDPDVMVGKEPTMEGSIQWMSPEVGQIISDIMNGKIENGRELELVDSQGYQKTVMLYAREERYLSDEVMLITLNDITIQKKAEAAMMNLALKDELTGLYNRHYLEMIIKNEIDYSEKYEKALSIILIDLDHFKQANDRWGHPVGDSVLKSIAQVIKNQVRSKDYVIRLGGEEFIILMPDVKLSKAKEKAENIRKAIEESVHPVAGITTASIGVAQRQKGESYRRLYKRVDRAMYDAKTWGRNYVVTSGEGNDKLSAQSMEWKEEWNSGDRMLDEQHKELFRLANRATDITPSVFKNKDEVLAYIDEILDHIKVHFEYEENVLEEREYYHLPIHADEHNMLLKRGMKLREAYKNNQITDDNLFVFIFDEVIVNHMLKEDIKFFDSIKLDK